MELSGQYVTKRLGGLRAARSGHETDWMKIQEILNPEGDPFIATPTPGVGGRAKVYDNTGELASDMLTSALIGLIVNPATPWMAIRAADDRLMRREDAALWYDEVTDITLADFNAPSRGFATEQFLKFRSLVNYGSAGMFIDEIAGFGARFDTRPLAELYVAENDDGRVDTVYRVTSMTARQIVDKFTRAGDDVPQNIRDKASKPEGQDERFTLIHATEPRRGRDSRRLDVLNAPFATAYVVEEGNHKIRESGYPENPWVFSRWDKRKGSEVYGRGQGHKARQDVQSLNHTMKLTFAGAALAIRPPLQAAHDGVLSPVRMTSAGITQVRADLFQYPGGGLRPIHSGVNPEFGEDFAEKQRQRVENAFFKPLILKFRDPRMTATQTLELVQEVNNLIGPMLGRVRVEDLDPMIQRVFFVNLRQGRYPEPPQVLRDTEFKIEYQSPAETMQKIADARAITNTVSVMEPFLLTNPEIIDRVDGDALFDHTARIFGWPLKTLRSDRAVAAIRQARQQAQAAEVAKQDAMAGGEAAAKLLPALQRMQGQQAGEAA
ncbi:MAG: portal protein [Sulfuritalea sp.]|nr:portal protein [Sulfuritalea sp.]